MSLIIAGDIGGTKTTLALYEISELHVHCIKQRTYSSHDYDQFNDILLQFLSKDSLSTVRGLSLSVAGPVIDQVCETTNLPWHICASTIQRVFGITSVKLLNDIEATGYGLLEAPESQLVQINPEAIIQEGNQAIISIGTGLGEAFLFWDGKKHSPCGTEGGHTDFAPLLESDLALWLHLKQKYPDHVSYERIVSGPGIALLYDFICQQHGVANPAPKTNTSAWISQQAIEYEDPLCSECMGIFVRLLANEAANLCLKVFSRGGVYIAGGIAPKILPLLLKQGFVDHFIQKGRFRPLLQAMPIWVNTNEQTPLNGAYQQALNLLEFPER